MYVEREREKEIEREGERKIDVCLEHRTNTC